LTGPICDWLKDMGLNWSTFSQGTEKEENAQGSRKNNERREEIEREGGLQESTYKAVLVTEGGWGQRWWTKMRQSSKTKELENDKLEGKEGSFSF